MCERHVCGCSFVAGIVDVMHDRLRSFPPQAVIGPAFMPGSLEIHQCLGRAFVRGDAADERTAANGIHGLNEPGINAGPIIGRRGVNAPPICTPQFSTYNRDAHTTGYYFTLF